MQEAHIAPSILSADFAQLGQDVSKALEAGADRIHFDVMDYHYVDNLTVGPLVCKALRRYGITAPIDVHLMVTSVDKLIMDFARAGASSISFHPDATNDIAGGLSLIRKQGCLAGLALNPNDSLDDAKDHLASLDILLLMSVNPGFAGQSFIPSTLEKISAARELIDSQQQTIRLAVDGGVNLENIGDIAKAGADTFVAGSALFKTENYKDTIDKMRAAIKVTASQI